MLLCRHFCFSLGHMTDHVTSTVAIPVGRKSRYRYSTLHDDSGFVFIFIYRSLVLVLLYFYLNKLYTCIQWPRKHFVMFTPLQTKLINEIVCQTLVAS